MSIRTEVLKKDNLSLLTALPLPSSFSLPSLLLHMQQAVDTLDLSPYVTSSDLQTALRQQTEASDKSLQRSTEALDRRVDSLDGELGKLTEQIQELQVSRILPIVTQLMNIFLTLTHNFLHSLPPPPPSSLPPSLFFCSPPSSLHPFH